MNKTMIGLAMASAAACLLAQAVMANEGEAEQICRNVVANKGYQGYHFKYVETMAARSGGYSVNGQTNKGGKRSGTCTVTAQGDVRGIMND
mgnify:CR=1 FL=1